MITDLFCDLRDTKFCLKQQPFRIFQADALQIFRVGHTGLLLDEPVKIILLEMEEIHQFLGIDILIMSLNIIAYFFEDCPVHGLLLFFSERELITGAQQAKDAKEQSLADVFRSNLRFIKLR